MIWNKLSIWPSIRIVYLLYTRKLYKPDGRRTRFQQSQRRQVSVSACTHKIHVCINRDWLPFIQYIMEWSGADGRTLRRCPMEKHGRRSSRSNLLPHNIHIRICNAAHACDVCDDFLNTPCWCCIHDTNENYMRYDVEKRLALALQSITY